MAHKRKLIVFILLFLAFVLGGYILPTIWKDYREKKAVEAFRPVGVPDDIYDSFAADFSRSLRATEPKFLPDAAFTSIQGAQVSLKDFSGKPTLVNLWATWCAPCVVELPSLEKLKNHYEGRLNVVSVAVSETRSLTDVGKFLESRQIGAFAGYKDEAGEFGEKNGVVGLPTTFLIGSDGHILYRFEGDADWASERSRAFFDAVLALGV